MDHENPENNVSEKNQFCNFLEFITFKKELNNWAETISENHVLYLLEINDFAGLFTEISRGWNQVGKLCGTIIDKHWFSSESPFTRSLSWPLKFSIIILRDVLFFFYFLNLRENDFSVFDQSEIHASGVDA